MSTINRRLGSGGKMYVPRLRYSLTMSFWVVPRSSVDATPCSSALATYIPSSQAAVALIVIEVFICPGGIWSSRVRMLAEMGDRDADLADLAGGQRMVGVVAGLGRQVEGDRQPGLPFGQVRAVQLVRRRVPRSAPSRSASSTVGPSLQCAPILVGRPKVPGCPMVPGPPQGAGTSAVHDAIRELGRMVLRRSTHWPRWAVRRGPVGRPTAHGRQPEPSPPGHRCTPRRALDLTDRPKRSTAEVESPHGRLAAVAERVDDVGARAAANRSR